jgi:hypothetical protein
MQQLLLSVMYEQSASVFANLGIFRFVMLAQRSVGQLGFHYSKKVKHYSKTTNELRMDN